jgi:hypothetical protein
MSNSYTIDVSRGRQVEMEEVVDFQNKRISMMYYPEDEIIERLNCARENCVLNLSDNYVDDDTMEQMMDNIFSNRNFLSKISSLNLSNNRMTPRIIKHLIPLFMAENVTRIDLRINYLTLSDVTRFLYSSDGSAEILKNSPQRIATREWDNYKQRLIGNILNKLVL